MRRVTKPAKRNVVWLKLMSQLRNNLIKWCRWWGEAFKTAKNRLERGDGRRQKWYRKLRKLPIIGWIVDGVMVLAEAILVVGRTWLLVTKPGKMSWYVLLMLSLRNLWMQRSRTVVTGGAIAVGIGTIVLLISFGYGLQNIVTMRLIHPNALRLIDVQSDSTALQLNQKAADSIRSIPSVVDVARTVSLAGSLTFGSQKTEIVVIGSENSYLRYDNVQLAAGSLFSEEADRPYSVSEAEVNRLTAIVLSGGEVAGTSEMKEYVEGDQADEGSIRFRGSDENYVPVYSKPTVQSKVIGYLRGSVVESYEGTVWWGGSYASLGVEGRSYRKQDGSWLGRWVKAKVPIWEELAPTIYAPLVEEGTTTVVVKEGYIPLGMVQQLTKLETEVEELSNKVLGVMDEKKSSSSAELVISGSATEAASLQELVIAETIETASRSANGGFVSVSREGGKEILVSTALLSLLKSTPEQIINKSVTLSMIVSGGLIPGVGGRVVSWPVNYTVVGVVKNDEQPLVIVPLGEITSMGVDRFSLIKVLAESEAVVKGLRERIEAVGFLTQSLGDTLVQVDKLFRVMRLLLGAVGMIALTVALLGMFNTLTISLMERTREIGVMKTLGTTNRDVIRLYLVESLVLGLGGGGVGLVFGVVVGQLFNLVFSLVRGVGGISLFVAPINLLVIMLAVSMLVGLLTGIMPAKRATQISALDALRYE